MKVPAQMRIKGKVKHKLGVMKQVRGINCDWASTPYK